MLKINEIHKAWWDENLVVCSFTHNEYVDMDAFYNIATGCVEEYSFMHDIDGEILNEITGEYEYIPAPEIKIPEEDEAQLINAICAYLND